jgi:AcrR family transcriptional regulator
MPRANRLSVDQRRAELLELGLLLFSERSYESVTTDEIAAAAGVSKGLLYHYFTGKRGFYVATIRELGRRLVEATELDPHLSFSDGIRDALGRFLGFVRDNGGFYRALMRGGVGQDEEIQRVIEGVRQTVIGRVQQQASIEALAPAQRIALYGWVGFTEAASLDWLDHGGDLPVEQLVDLLLHALVAALGAGASLH